MELEEARERPQDLTASEENSQIREQRQSQEDIHPGILGSLEELPVEEEEESIPLVTFEKVKIAPAKRLQESTSSDPSQELHEIPLARE